MAMDSDGEREDDEERQDSLYQSTEQPTYTCTACPGDETDGPRLMVQCPRARVTSMVISKSDTFNRKDKARDKFYCCQQI